MISPYAVRLIVQDRSSSGRHAGQLYFVSTFGSAAGTLLTSFYLVLIMEVNHILIALMATAACNRDRLGSSITKSAWGERPIVFRSPQTRIIAGRWGSVGAGRRQAVFTQTYETRPGCE